MAYCMTCGEEKALKTPTKSVSTTVEETARDSGMFNYGKTVGFCGAPCATKAITLHIIQSGGNGYHCGACGEVIGETCACG